MIHFILESVTQIDYSVLENGDISQICSLIVKIEGTVIKNKTIKQSVQFIVPNEIMTSSPTPALAAWKHIQEVLAPEWVAANYAEEIIVLTDSSEETTIVTENSEGTTVTADSPVVTENSEDTTVAN